MDFLHRRRRAIRRGRATEVVGAVHDGVDVVQGYKLKRQDPCHRVLIGALYRRVARILFSVKIRDVDCDFRLLRRSVLEKIELEHNSGIVCVELVRKLQDAGARFVEVPVHHYRRSYGRSQFFTLRRIVEVGIDMARLWWQLVVRQGTMGSRDACLDEAFEGAPVLVTGGYGFIGSNLVRRL